MNSKFFICQYDPVDFSVTHSARQSVIILRLTHFTFIIVLFIITAYRSVALPYPCQMTVQKVTSNFVGLVSCKKVFCSCFPLSVCSLSLSLCMLLLFLSLPISLFCSPSLPPSIPPSSILPPSFPAMLPCQWVIRSDHYFGAQPACLDTGLWDRLSLGAGSIQPRQSCWACLPSHPHFSITLGLFCCFLFCPAQA